MHVYCDGTKAQGYSTTGISFRQRHSRIIRDFVLSCITYPSTSETRPLCENDSVSIAKTLNSSLNQMRSLSYGVVAEQIRPTYSILGRLCQLGFSDGSSSGRFEAVRMSIGSVG